MDSNVPDVIPDKEKAWLRNEQCFMIYGKSFEFFRKWEGDQTEAQIFLNGKIDNTTEPLFDSNSKTYLEIQGKHFINYKINSLSNWCLLDYAYVYSRSLRLNYCIKAVTVKFSK